MAVQIWHRSEGDFAILVEGIHGSAGDELVVDQGTKALFFHDGKLVEHLSPGKYSLGVQKWFSFAKDRAVKVILVDAGTAPLHFTAEGLKTSDPLFIKLECDLVIRVDDPDRFYLNLFKGHTRFGVRELASLLSDEVRNGLSEELRRISVKELSESLELKDQLGRALESHLSKSLALYGLAFVQLRTLSASHARYDTISKAVEDLVIQTWEKESDLVGRKQLFEMTSQEELQGIYEATKKAEQEEKRVEANARLRKEIMTGKMDEIRDDQAFSAFLDEVDKERILGEKEKDELKKTFREKGEDHERARGHLLRKIDIEQKFELRRLELLGTQSQDQELLTLSVQTERLKFEQQLALEQETSEARRTEELKERKARLESVLAETQNEKERELVLLEIKQAKSDLGLSNLERIKFLKLKTQRERMVMEAEAEERKLALRLREQEQTHKLELERLKALAELSPEALIVASESDKAVLLTELKKTEILGTWSEDKILAEAARNSPEVAKAFQERFKNMSSEQMKEMYERMLKDRDQAYELYRDEQRQTREDLKEITGEALKSSRPGAQVVYPPSQGVPGQPINTSPGLTCTGCGTLVSAQANFCTQCGNKLK
jgi:hypothetical protein